MAEDSADYDVGVPIEWRNLSVIADVKKNRIFGRAQHNYQTIIDNVNGWVSPGNLVAILGPSGSGKSTLMSVLANRRQESLLVKGTVEVGGRKIGKFMRQISGFVFQDDLFPAALTVHEHLNFVAQVKLSHKINSEARKQLISNLLTELNLQKCANVVIRDVGFDTEKVLLSGGEQKRVSVAVELLTNPALLFCDEPTTGLDSFSAFQLISILKHMASDKGKTIICSIHQPNPQIFDLFDQIILLQQGRIAFMGTQRDAVANFERQGELCREDQNPADFLLKKLSVNPVYEKQLHFGKNISSPKYKNMSVQFEDEDDSPLWIYKLCVMTKRAFLQAVRDRSEYLLLIVQNLISAVIIAMCTQGSVKLTQHGVQALQAVVFFIGCELFSNQLFPVMDHFMKQMALFRREYTNGTNSVSIFLLSNILCMFPGYIFIAIMFTSVFQVLAPLRQSYTAFWFSCLISIAITHVTFAFGMLLPMIFNSDLAYSVSVPIIYIFSTLTGVYINLRSIPSIVSWITYLSWPTYGIEALLNIQLNNVEHIACPSNPYLPCWKNGDDVLHRLGFVPNTAWTNLKYMIFMYVVMVILSCIILYIRVATRRL